MIQNGSNLWNEIQQGKESAFEVLFMNQFEPLVRFASRFHDDYEDQREVVQQVFADLWIKRESIQIKSSIKAYLYQAVRNRCIGNIRHLKVRQKHAEQSTAQESSSISASDSLLHAELAGRIAKTLSELPDRTQEVFRLSREEGLKYREIAELLQVSIKTVEFQMGKALSLLRKQLADYLPIILIPLAYLLFS